LRRFELSAPWMTSEKMTALRFTLFRKRDGNARRSSNLDIWLVGCEFGLRTDNSVVSDRSVRHPVVAIYWSGKRIH
jgi:hypothetical protein